MTEGMIVATFILYGLVLAFLIVVVLDIYKAHKEVMRLIQEVQREQRNLWEDRYVKAFTEIK